MSINNSKYSNRSNFGFELIRIFTILNNKLTIFRFKKVGKKTH